MKSLKPSSESSSESDKKSPAVALCLKDSFDFLGISFPQSFD